jgi:hypothetical protein
MWRNPFSTVCEEKQVSLPSVSDIAGAEEFEYWLALTTRTIYLQTLNGWEPLRHKIHVSEDGRIITIHLQRRISAWRAFFSSDSVELQQKAQVEVK